MLKYKTPIKVDISNNKIPITMQSKLIIIYMYGLISHPRLELRENKRPVINPKQLPVTFKIRAESKPL